MRFPNEKKWFWEEFVFFVFASPDWQHGPDLHLLCKYKSLVVLNFCICIEDGGSSTSSNSTQGVENMNTSLLIRVSFNIQAAKESESWGLLPKYPSEGIFVTRDLWTSVIMSKGIHRPPYCTHGAIYTTILQFHILAPDWSEFCTIVEFDSIILWSVGEKRRWIKSIFEAFSENNTWK